MTGPSLAPAAGPPIDTSTYDAIRDGALRMLGMTAIPGTGLRLAPFRVPETAIHDFTQYVFLRDPNSFVGVDTGAVPSQSDLDQYLQAARDLIRYIVETWCATEIGTGTYRVRNLVPMFTEFEGIIYQLFLANAAGDLYELSSRVAPGYANSSGSVRADILAAFGQWLTVLVQQAQFDPNTLAASFDNPMLWTDAANEIRQTFHSMFPDAVLSGGVGPGEASYSFSPFPSGLVNFGLRLVYRQEWRPLGTQSGEIVRTIPLGPKQTERVSTKVVIAQREARTTESFVSTETSTEASNVTRESSDVVEEASSSLKWHVDAEASANVGFVSAKLSAGVAGDTASSSKDTKSRLNETMQKTASKMRRDMKVVVSTERSITEETTTASEITNPNDEVAITYVYSKLQRQYEIQTTLAEVNSVVLVPEYVPAWDEITPTWIRRYDWILSRVVLDSTFAADLAEIAREPDEIAPTDTAGLITGAATNASNGIASYKDYKGGTLPDFFSTVQGAYERHLERKRGSDINQARRDQRNNRLIAHIRQNILHYMRAIWAAEDADQRLRRYAKTLVPTRWTFVPYGPPDPAQPELEVDGEFLPDLGPQSIRPLSDIINPAGPVGYTGNYAVYYLRGDPRLLQLNGALTLLRAQYARFLISVQGAGVPVRQSVALAPRYRVASYNLQRTGAGTWTGIHQASGTAVTVSADDGDRSVRFDGLFIWFDTAPAVGASITVDLRATGELEDPELRVLRTTTPGPTAAEEAGYYNEGLLRDLTTYLPEVGVLFPADLSGGWAALNAEAQDVVRANYHRYMLLKEHTRRFLLETNNLMIDLEVGQTPGLEEFKRLHRVVDVLKELEEASRRAIENERRSRRIVQGDFADADIEQVTVVGGAAELRTIVGPVVGSPAAATTPGGTS